MCRGWPSEHVLERSRNAVHQEHPGCECAKPRGNGPHPAVVSMPTRILDLREQAQAFSIGHRGPTHDLALDEAITLVHVHPSSSRRNLPVPVKGIGLPAGSGNV